MYWATGTSSSDITAEAEATNNLKDTGGQISSFSGDTSDNILDPRFLSTGNFTSATGVVFNTTTEKMPETTTHLQVYSGNEAGDQTTPATLAIYNAGVNYSNSGGTTGDTAADNSTLGAVVPTGSANAFQIFHTNSTDGGVIARALTDVKGKAVTASGASAAHNTSATYAVTGAVAAMGTTDAVYVLVQDNVTSDNGTFYSRTGTSGDLSSATGKLNDSYPIRKGAMLLPVSDTKAYAVWARSSSNANTDNDTNVYASLLTLSGGTVSVSNIADSVAAKSADNNTQLANASLAYGADNSDALPNDFPICAAARAESTSVSELAIGYVDNGTRQGVNPNYYLRFTRDSDNFSLRTTASDVGVDSSVGNTATQSCAMTWAGGLVNTTTATDNGTLWWAGNTSSDNDSQTVSLRYSTTADNGSSATFTAAGTVDYSNAVHQLALSYDHKYRPYMAALLDNGSVRLHWSADGSTPAAYNGGVVSNVGDSAKPIALTRSADGKQLALSYHTNASNGSDLKVVVIYADGTSN